MKGAIHVVVCSLSLLGPSLLGLGLGTGCATIVDISVDERAELSRYRTWSYAVSTVDASRSEAAPLHQLLAPLIEEALSARGFEHTLDGADFLVGYHFGLRYQVELVDTPRAPYLLSSSHSSASYWIEGSDQERRTYRDLRLAIDVTDRTGRAIWQGELQRRREAYTPLGLANAVAKLLERFPQRSGS